MGNEILIPMCKNAPCELNFEFSHAKTLHGNWNSYSHMQKRCMGIEIRIPIYENATWKLKFEFPYAKALHGN